MDASAGSKHEGNGHADPPATPLPSSAAAGGHGQPPEPLVVVDSEGEQPKPWKPKPKQRAFLAAIAETGNITRAAKLARIPRRSHYDWVETEPAYGRAFETAMEEACDNLEAEARRRATKGTLKPVFYEGEKCGAIREYSDTLLIFLLKGSRPEKYRERYEHTGAGGKPLHPDKVDVHVKLDLKVLNDDELEQYAGLVSKLAARGGAGTLPGQN